MNAAVPSSHRFRPATPCPVCRGHALLERGRGERCHGFRSSDGRFAHCSREEYAGDLPLENESRTFAHRLDGPCACSQTHGDAPPRTRSERANGAGRIVAEYDYRDEAGTLLYQIQRREPKRFVARRPNGNGWSWSLSDVRRVLYRLPELVQAVAAGDTIHVVEGERDADAIHATGGVATCNPGGAGKWRPGYAEVLREAARVIVVPDLDAPGWQHALDVVRSLEAFGLEPEVRQARSGKDAADHLAAGHSLEALVPVDRQELESRARGEDAPEPDTSSDSPAFETLDAEGGYRLTVAGLSATLEVGHLRRERHQLRGEVLARCALAGASTFGGVLSVSDCNLSSARSRRDYAAHLADRAKTEPEPWTSAVEELAQRVLAAEREGAPDVSLAEVVPEPVRTLDILGLLLPRHHPAVLFGDGDSAKSYLTLYVLGRLAQEGLRVGLADWELSESDHRERLGRLFPKALPAVRYLRCARSIVHEADRLRRWVRDRRLDYVALDSVAYASAGAPESAEVAMAYFQVVRQLGPIGSLHIAHVTKAQEGGDRRPFGSTFWHNSPRATWYAKLAERDPGGSVSRLGLYPRKWNVGPLPAAVGLELVFQAERTTVRRADLAQTPDLAASLPVRQRMAAALRGGSLTAAELADEIGTTAQTVRSAVRRYREHFQLADGVISLLERRARA